MTVIIRRPVSNVTAEVASQAAGQAMLTYFGDKTGTRPIFQTAALTLRADGNAQIGASDGVARSIRRTQIDTPGQTVRLSRLTRYPVGEGANH